MLLNLINNICSSPRTANREPRTANREPSSLNFFNSFKDKFLFVKICLALLLQKFNINLVKSFIKESKIIRSFFVEKKNHAKGGQSSKNISFCQKEDKAKARFQRKTIPFRIRNSLVKTLSLRGDSRSNPIYVDCFTPFAMTIKNNFAILNLVKTFLTSITFDSLSEKIKNLRLVIKKFQTRRIFK